MGTVIVLGSLITDLVARAPRLPQPGEVVVGDEFATYLGGKGINQAIAASRLGAQVTLIGSVGTDAFGDAFFPVLEQEDITSTYVTRDTTNGTGVSLLVIDSTSGQNTIVVNPRANLSVTAEAVETALRAVQKQHIEQQTPGKILFLAQCETSSVSYLHGIQLAHSMGMMTLLNAAPVPHEKLDDGLLAQIDILIVNETEAAALSGTPLSDATTTQQAAAVLLQRGSQHILITLGAQGCLWCTRESNGAVVHQLIPPFAVKAVDATAAGDAFCGALAASLADERPMAQALQRASAAGAIAATCHGAIASLPTAVEVEQLVNSGM